MAGINLTRNEWNETERTRERFDSWTYASEAQSSYKQLYTNCGRALSPHLHGRVLDIGNGGVFNYDCSKISTLHTLELAVAAIDLGTWPGGVHLAQGDCRAIPYPDGSFDCVVLQFLIHHLAGRTSRESDRNVLVCLEECRRVLAPRGRLLIVESLLPRVLESAWVAGWEGFRVFTALLQFPMVKQYSLSSLQTLAAQAGLANLQATPVEIGRYVSQFGFRIPAAFSPVRVALLTMTKG